MDETNRLRVKDMLMEMIEKGLYVKYEGVEVLVPDEIQSGLTTILRDVEKVDKVELKDVKNIFKEEIGLDKKPENSNEEHE